MELIDWLHLTSCFLFLVAALHKIYKRQAEHFFTRFLIAAWFGLTVWGRDLPVEFVRVMSNYVLMLLPVIEITSPMFRKYWRHKV